MFKKQDGIAKAQKRFEKGYVEDAAWLLNDERRRALAHNDSGSLEEIDEVVSVMRERLAHDERLAAFDAHLVGRESPGPAWTELTAHLADDEEPADVTPLSFGIVLAGAGLMLLGVFLPQFESNTFARIEKNTLIQNGDGWWFILLAVIAAGAAYRAYRNQRRSFASVVVGAIGIGLAFYYGTSHSQRKLCSLSPGFGQHCTLGTPGIGIYAAGVGGLLILIGGWQIFRSDRAELPAEETQAPPAPSQAPSGTTIADRLRTLDQLRDDGLVTDAEHARRRAALIDEV